MRVVGMMGVFDDEVLDRAQVGEGGIREIIE
jgi:hypothetical protein